MLFPTLMFLNFTLYLSVVGALSPTVTTHIRNYKMSSLPETWPSKNEKTEATYIVKCCKLVKHISQLGIGTMKYGLPSIRIFWRNRYNISGHKVSISASLVATIQLGDILAHHFTSGFIQVADGR